MLKISVLLALLSLFASSAHAEDPKEITELCASQQIEGTFLTELDGIGEMRFTIICTGPGSMAASFRNTNGGGLVFALHFVAIDGPFITFTSYPIDAEHARGVPADGLSRIRLNLAALKAGSLEGDYRGLRTLKPIEISGTRESRLPNLQINASALPSPDALEGSFAVTTRELSFSFSLETVGGIQRANIMFGSGMGGYFLPIGLVSAEAGNSFYVTSGIAEEAGGRGNLIHLRGRAISDTELEVYYLDTNKGLLGPFRAQRY